MFLSHGKKACLSIMAALEVKDPLLGSFNFLLKVVPPDTCLIHGVEDRDATTQQRWFAYYGADRARFRKSFEFAYQYTAGQRPIQFWKVLRPLPLLFIPYVQLGEATSHEENLAQIMVLHIIRFLESFGERLPVVQQQGLETCIHSVFDGILGVTEADSLLAALQKYRPPARMAQNPDFVLADVLCAMGFSGWVRLNSAEQDTYSPANEIFVCNLENLVRQGFLAESSDCDLR